MSDTTTTTTPSSMSKRGRSTSSPINTVPYDVLIEIFIHCLPQYPLEIRQPDTTIAPMLLCQICSSWRRIAFTSPFLWSHLSYHITLYEVDEELGSFAFLQNEVDFILWWKRKQGSMAPFLRFHGSYGPEIEVPKSRILAGDGISFLENYLTSAQYLQINPLVELVLEKVTEFGHQVVCLDLHTVVTCELPDDGRVDHNNFYRLPSYAPSLRHLFLRDNYAPQSRTIPDHWLTLTHLSLFDVALPLDFWFPLVRELLNLQWAHIIFHSLYDIKNYTKPSTFIHYQLSTLFLGYKWSEHTSDIAEFPLSLLFTGLYLPALCTLSLYSDMSPDVISDIHAILQSTPAITSLAIRGYEFLSQYDTVYHMDAFSASQIIEAVWNRVPRLTHLQLALPATTHLSEAKTEEILDSFVRDLFFSNCPWMDLNNSACPIRRITLIDEKQSNPRFGSIRDYTMSSIQKRTGRPPNITFKVISDADSEDVVAEDAWKEWSSSVQI